MIAFVRPRAPLNRYIQNVPLNYLALAAWVRERGCTPLILDMALPAVTPATVDEAIRRHGVRVAGIGAMTCELPQALDEARRLKAAHPGIRVVFGGAHPSADPQECLASGVVDYVVAGEGEAALEGLLTRLRRGEEPEERVLQAPAPDVGALPRPAFDLLDLEAYFRLESPWHFPKSPRAVQFMTSRGCPYHCSYCHEIHGKRFRGIAAETVLDQMEWLAREHGVEEFLVVDDIFNFDLERAKRICRGVVERGLRVHLQFPNGVRGDRFDAELIALMRAAGTHYLAIAIETVAEKYQRLIRKNLRIEPSRQAVRWAREQGIEVCGFFMIGFPGETEAEVRRTIDFALSEPFDAIFLSLVAPFKGTRLRADMAEGRFGELGGEAAQALEQLFPVVENPALPAARLEQLRREAYWRFYTRPRALWNLARRMTNAHNARKLARAVRRRVFEPETSSVN